MAEAPGARLIGVTVVASLGPRQTQEWTLALPDGGTVADALRACGLDDAVEYAPHGGDPSSRCEPAVGIWGRATTPQAPLQDGDRVEVYRPLQVDPKTARRERCARPGARATGVFARRRPGAHPGY